MKTYIINEDLLAAVENYLSGCPFAQVNNFMLGLSQLKELPVIGDNPQPIEIKAATNE
jgi:hypothetical protein